MPNTIAPVYPFDPSGTAVTNKIENEQQILTPANGVDYHLIVPLATPFFEQGLSISIVNLDNSVRNLVNGVDYQCTHWFISASRACATPIFGSITIFDRTLAGIIRLNYQTIGGSWTINDAGVAQVLADTLHNPRITAWEEVTNYPATFPPVDHQWDLVDMVGMSDVVTGVNDIRTALINKIASDQALNTQLANAMTVIQAGGTLDQAIAHMASIANPHQTTAAQVGAYTIAEINSMLNIETQAREDGDVSALSLAKIYADNLNTTVAAAILGETSRAQGAEATLVPKITTVNGHQLNGNVVVTKGDVGLGSCDNTSDANKPVSTAQAAADATALATAKAYADSLIAAGGIPVGVVIDYPGTTAPTGFLVVPTYAVNLSRTTYANLHTQQKNAGYPYGAGDGSTTFTMPWEPADYAAVQASANVGTQTTGVVKSHMHAVVSNSTDGNAGTASLYSSEAGGTYTNLNLSLIHI